MIDLRIVINRFRYHVGRKLYYLGYRIQPEPQRRGLECMAALGITWAKNDEATFLKVMSGELSIEWRWTAPTNPDAGAS